MKIPARHAQRAGNRRAFDEASAQAIPRPTRDAYPDRPRVEASPPPPDSEIVRLLKEQARELTDLDSLITLLRERLGPISAAYPACDGKNESQTANSEVGAHINRHTAQIVGMRSTVQQIINELAI